ncbi:uncharacterized protein LOC122274488 [Carya illinoinensis]|uniref:uncharacterized protein LOC122274488 n=1 Tax=Carya illinoinensis TaxID=32201 RepID=UPI001C721D21|nr:uncharacterized protein LOC122274488 [Carya illinoinensis]
MWDTRAVEKMDERVGEYTASTSFKNVEDSYRWSFVCVYGPNSNIVRRGMWDELAGLCSLWSLPWCIGGDFNVTRFPSEHIGRPSPSSAMTDFAKFICEQELLDIPLVGATFTWSSNREHPASSRLDRFLILPDCEVHFLGLIKKRLPRLYSDHFPILIDCGGIQGGFVERVRQWWPSYLIQGNQSYVLACTLKALKVNLKKWYEQIFKNVEHRKKSLLDELQGLEDLEERGLLEEEKAHKKHLILDIEVALMEETSWKQKLRALQLKEGDKCTKFFHHMLIRIEDNIIESLLVDGRITLNPIEITNHITNYYAQLLSKQFSWRPCLDGLVF